MSEMNGRFSCGGWNLIYREPFLAAVRAIVSIIVLTMVVPAFSACAHYPVNRRLGEGRPTPGADRQSVRFPERSDELYVVLAFSGGGTRAAACGGVTTIIDFSSQGNNNNLIKGVEDRRRLADGRVCVDYSLHSTINSFGRIKNIKQEFKRLMEMGITSHKLFMIYEQEGWQSHPERQQWSWPEQSRYRSPHRMPSVSQWHQQSLAAPDAGLTCTLSAARG